MTDTTTEIAAPSAPLLRTPLYDQHVALGARMVPFAGWEMPVQYAGVIAEVKAVREHVGIFDVSHMGRVEVQGADADALIQSVSVNDVTKLPAGAQAGHYSLLCNPDGGVIDDIIVYRMTPDTFQVVVNASNRDKAVPHVKRVAVGKDVSVADHTEGTALLAVQGPRAIELVSRLAGSGLRAVSRFGWATCVVGSVPILAARTGYTGEDGFELFCDGSDAPTLWAALVAEGAVPCGLGARDTLRIEAALPLYGHEMNEHTSPYAARLGWVIKLDKGDFIGRDALKASKATQTHKLVGLAMQTRGIPRDGYPVLQNGESVGVVTSGTFSPVLGKGIALARVVSTAATMGTSLAVSIRGTEHGAEVVPLPFYKRAETAANAL